VGTTASSLVSEAPAVREAAPSEVKAAGAVTSEARAVVLLVAKAEVEVSAVRAEEEALAVAEVWEARAVAAVTSEARDSCRWG